MKKILFRMAMVFVGMMLATQLQAQKVAVKTNLLYDATGWLSLRHAIGSATASQVISWASMPWVASTTWVT